MLSHGKTLPPEDLQKPFEKPQTGHRPPLRFGASAPTSLASSLQRAPGTRASGARAGKPPRPVAERSGSSRWLLFVVCCLLFVGWWLLLLLLLFLFLFLFLFLVLLFVMVVSKLVVLVEVV